MKAVIGIDAGHGGNSYGTYSCNTVSDGLFEKDYTLEQALMIEKKLLENGFGVVMTRRTDTNPGTVTERAAKTVKGKADFAISLHFNGVDNKAANGCEIFVPYGERAAQVEKRIFENLGQIFKSRKPFAKSSSFYDRNKIFDKKLNLKTGRFDAADDEKDYFGFVRKCWAYGISADLIEICFLTNPEDFKKYTENKEKIADIIAKSIVEAFGGKYFSEEKAKTPKTKPKIKKSMKHEKSKGDFHIRD